MFLRVRTRRKDGKTHRYWSVVENRRVRGGSLNGKDRVVQRQVLYLGELNDAQRAGWVRTIEALEGSAPAAGAPYDGKKRPVASCDGGGKQGASRDGDKRPLASRDGNKRPAARQLALFPDDLARDPEAPCEVARILIGRIELRNPRQWGACWLAMWLWELLGLDAFWAPLLPPSRKGTRWLNVLKALVAYRLIDPGSEWRFHREWYLRSAMGDLLGEDFALAQKDKPYRCLDRLPKHRGALFQHLQRRWGELFGAEFDVLLYDLTSTYFESDPPPPGSKSKRRFGYSRDHRGDCVQVVVALVVTPEGLPLAYEVYPGNTTDTATLREFLDRIEQRYGKARRTWLMDRGIPTEATLSEMRERGARYLVGTPKGRLTKLERRLLGRPWRKVRDNVSVKVLPDDGEFYVLVQSADRVAKERSMRRRRLKKLWARLGELRAKKNQKRDDLLMRLGSAKKEAGRAWGLVNVAVPNADQPVNETTFRFELDRAKLRRAVGREGRYLLRSNMDSGSPETAWESYLLLTRIEQAFKDLKGDLSIRPVHHQLDARIESHIFVSFLAYCLHTTLRNLARERASGLTTRTILDKFASLQMIDVHLPTTDGRAILLRRHTHPDDEVNLLLDQLGLTLPSQPSPRLNALAEHSV